MDLLIVLTCEYLFDETECITYLNSINIDKKKYEYVYHEFIYGTSSDKKRIRKLKNVINSELSEYPNLMMIKFSDIFNQKITKLPHKLTHLILDNRISKPHAIPHWPDTLTHLELCEYDHSLNDLPDRLIYLYIGDYFSQKILILPKYLMVLILGEGYNHPFSSLPHTLRHLVLGDYYNHELPSLPNSMKQLYLGHFFNHKIILPQGLMRLRVSNDYKYKLDLPCKLTAFSWYSEHISLILPDKLKYLCVDFNTPFKLLIPQGLTHLTIECNRLPQLPNGLKFLYILGDLNEDIKSLPDELEQLILPRVFNSNILQWPSKLRILKLGECFNHTLLNLPMTLERLELNDVYNHEIILPSALKYLRIGTEFNKLIKFPPELQTLIWHNGMKLQPLINKLPNLVCLYVDHYQEIWNFPKSLKQLHWFTVAKLQNLPCSLEYLKLGTEFHNILPILPDNIQEIHVWRQYKYLNQLIKQYGNKISYL
jgi:hypothetical protein